MNSLTTYSAWLLQRHARSALIWTISFTAYVAMILAIFPSMEGTVDETLNSLPDVMTEMFNVENMSTPIGFLGAEVFSYAPLVIAFFPIMMLAGAIAGEEERGSMDIFLAQPLARREMVIANAIIGAFWTLVIVTVAGLVAWLESVLLDIDLSFGDAMGIHLNVFPTAMVFGCLGLATGAVMRGKGSASGAAFGIMFLLYLVDLMGKLNDSLSGLRVISPFRWYGTFANDCISWAGVTILLAASLVLVVAAVALFNRRDVYT